jgi:cell division protein ZapA
VSEESAKAVSVRILDKDYRIGCPEGEEEKLLAAARLLDQRMKEIRTGGKVIGTERIAVMVALNLAHEVLSLPNVQGEQADAVSRRIRSLRERVEAALNESSQLEL